MEGPSLLLAAEQLQPFCGKEVLSVSGTEKIDHKLFLHKQVRDIFSWGKHLVLQFDEYALRIHFMLFGTYRTVVGSSMFTGDYKPNGSAKLIFEFDGGRFEMYNCSLKILEGNHVQQYYDFSLDVLSAQWNPLDALRKVEMAPEEEIGDILLDQDIFAGVGNVIRNESMWLTKIHPTKKVSCLSTEQLQQLIHTITDYAKKMHEWRKTDTVHEHDNVYRQMNCPECGADIIRQQTGRAKRWSYFCPVCQT